MQLDVQCARPEATAVHRREHLHLVDRVQPEPLRDPLGHPLQQPVVDDLGAFAGDEVEIARRAPRSLRQLTAVDAVGVDDDL